MWPAIGVAGATGIGQGIGSALGGGGAAPQFSQSESASHPNINIAPVGVNLGAILQPFTQGAPKNGGSGIDYASRFLNGLTMKDGNVTLEPSGDGTTDWFFIGTAVVIAGGIILFNKKKRG